MEARLSENAQKYDRDTAATLGSIVESKNGGWLRTRLALPSVLDRLPCQLQARQSVSKSLVSVSPQAVNVQASDCSCPFAYYSPHTAFINHVHLRMPLAHGVGNVYVNVLGRTFIHVARVNHN